MIRPKHRKSYDILGNFSYYVPSVGQMFVLLALLLVGAVLGSILSMPFMLMLGSEAGMEMSMIISYPVMFIPPMIYASVRSKSNRYLNDGVKLDSNHFSPVGALVCALLAMALTLAGSYIADLPASWLPEMPERLAEALESMTSGNVLIDFICVSLFAPFFEEWLCRGMVLRGLLHHNIKPVWAIVISAAFFAFIHMNPWQAVPAFILGCVMGYVYYRTGSLKLTMLMHFTNNTFALVMSHIDGLEEMENYQQMFPGAMYWAIFAACFAVAVLAIMKFSKVTLQSPEGNQDKLKSLFSEQPE